MTAIAVVIFAVAVAVALNTLIVLAGRLRTELMKVQASAARLEEAARVVAANLVLAQTAVDGVASDLADSHERADATEGPHGAAADAASQSAPVVTDQP